MQDVIDYCDKQDDDYYGSLVLRFWKQANHEHQTRRYPAARTSRVMDDVPEGGANTSATVIPRTASPSPSCRTSVSLIVRVAASTCAGVHLAVRTQDTDTYMGANVIVAEPQ